MTSCKSSSEKEFVNPKVGKIEIQCEQAYYNLIKQHEEIFENDFKHAQIDIKTGHEINIVNKFLNDTVNMMVVSHPLDTSIMRKLAKRSLYPRMYRFGKSAIAFIVNKNFSQDKISYQKMIELLLKDKSDYKFLIENMKSGIALDLLNHTKTTNLGKTVYAMEDKEAIFQRVKEDKSLIGVVDWCELSDSDDELAQKKLSEVKLIAISSEESKGEYVYPYQGNLNGLYPFTREMYLIKRTGVGDVGLGFAAFVCEERGQKIVLKAGLLPEYQTERWIEFKGLKSVNVVE